MASFAVIKHLDILKYGNPDKQALAVKLYDEKQHTIAQICEMMSITKPTLYKYIEAARKTK